MPTSVVEFTTGEPGSGKSYRRCAWLILDRVLNPKVPDIDKIISNYPVQFEPWTDPHGVEQPGLLKMAFDRYGIEADEVYERVRIFPEEVVNEWVRYNSKIGVVGPWKWFEEEEFNLSGWHIAIDEIHNFCPRRDNKASIAWQKWLGEIRHEGATIEFLTQHPSKVNTVIENHAGIKRYLQKNDSRRDYFFQIRMNDWYNVLTLVGQEYRPSVWEVESRQVKGKWVDTDEFPFWFNPELYGVYNTHSASIATGGQGASKAQPYEQLGRVALLWWFVSSNWFRLLWNRLTRGFGIIGGILLLSVSMPYLGPMMQAGITEHKGGDEPGSVVSSGELQQVADIELVTEMRKEIALVEQRIEKVLEFAEELDGTNSIVGIMPGKVIYASGQRARVGDDVRLIDGEVLRILRIDYDKREVYYVNGSVGRLYNNHGMQERAATVADRTSELRQYLQGGSSSQGGSETR